MALLRFYLWVHTLSSHRPSYVFVSPTILYNYKQFKILFCPQCSKNHAICYFCSFLCNPRTEVFVKLTPESTFPVCQLDSRGNLTEKGVTGAKERRCGTG
jgi:hypothetical protein